MTSLFFFYLFFFFLCHSAQYATVFRNGSVVTYFVLVLGKQVVLEQKDCIVTSETHSKSG